MTIIKFVKRGKPSVETISQDDLGASTSMDNLQLLDQERMQESDLPKEITIGYINKGADYQQGTQFSLRMTVNSINKASIDLPIALDDDEAKQIADTIMYNQWVSRTSFKFTLSNKYRYLEPTDVITVNTTNATHKLLILKKDETSEGVITFECVADESSTYIFNSAGGAAPVPDETVEGLFKSRVYILDTSLLRDSDDNCGAYVAAAGVYPDGWAGCVLYKSTDNATWSRVTSINTPSIIGVASTALPVGRTDIFDETNSVTIQFPYSVTLPNATESTVLNGSNYALIGSEVVGFKNATQIDATTWRLSGLLRGCRGTEWAMTNHVIGDTFIYLDPSKLIRISFDTSEIGTTRYFKAVTIGDTITNTGYKAVDFTNQGQECYAPCQLVGILNATNYTFKWIRRNKTAGAWRDGVDVPNTEASESYTVKIYDTGFTSLKRTISGLTSPTTTYTSAENIADFGSYSAFGVRVYQISALMGEGNYVQDTFPTPVSGFYYSTDFSEYTTGVAPANWTERWQTTYFSSTVETDGVDNFIKFAQTTLGRTALSYDGAGSLADAEVLIRVKNVGRDTTTGYNLARAVLRGGGGAATENGYFVSLDRDLVGYAIQKYVNGVSTSLSLNTTVTYTLTDWVWIRFQAQGTTLRAKVWVDGNVEPTSWQQTITDTSLTTGWVGVGSFDVAADIEVSDFTVTQL